MERYLSLGVLLAVAVSPLLVPWRRPFIAALILVWFGLWALFFVEADYEASHVAASLVTGKGLLGAFIALFAAAAAARLLVRGVVLWRMGQGAPGPTSRRDR